MKAARPKVAGVANARCNNNGAFYVMAGHCGNCHSYPVLGMFTRGYQAKAGVLGPACGCSSIYWDRLATPAEQARAEVATPS